MARELSLAPFACLDWMSFSKNVDGAGISRIQRGR